MSGRRLVREVEGPKSIGDVGLEGSIAHPDPREPLNTKTRHSTKSVFNPDAQI